MFGDEILTRTLLLASGFYKLDYNRPFYTK